MNHRWYYDQQRVNDLRHLFCTEQGYKVKKIDFFKTKTQKSSNGDQCLPKINYVLHAQGPRACNPDISSLSLAVQLA
jgi:hypothetical protein